MIYFGTCVGYPDKFRQLCVPGIQRSMSEPYGHLNPPSNGKDIFPVYQNIMGLAKSLSYVEALVLMHDDLELQDVNFAKKIRAALTEDTAIVGCIGARYVKSLNWWEGEGRGYAVDGRNGRTVVDFGFPDGDPDTVDSVDGMLLCLSRWAIDNLSLEGLGYEGFHGYPEELCFQARRLGKKVKVTKLDLFHHTQGGVTMGNEGYEKSNEIWKARWL